MKKFLLLLSIMFSLGVVAQTQTFSTPPIIKGVQRVDSNTKLLSVNPTTNKVEYVDKATIIDTSAIHKTGTASQFIKGNGSLDSNAYTLDTDVVHKTGDEIIGNRKSFSGKIDIGAGFSADDSAILIHRNLSGGLGSFGAHALRDETAYLSNTVSSATELNAYASFDAIPVVTGTANFNHLHGFQGRLNFGGTNTIEAVRSFTSQSTLNNGTINQNNGLFIDDYLGNATVNQNYGILIKPLIKGVSNFAIYSEGTAPSFFAGRIQSNGILQGYGLRLDNYTGNYGQIPSLDSVGNLIDNPNLTIVNGTLEMKANTAKIKSTATDLKLESVYGFDITTNGTKGFKITANGGRTLLGATDNGIDKLQVNGTIAASPATLGTQVPIYSQLAIKYLNEGNGNGAVYGNQSRTFYGNIGLDAIDFSYSDVVSSNFGATGENSFATGISNISSGYNSTTFGYLNTNASVSSFVNGTNNQLTGYANNVLGVGVDVTGTNITVVGQAPNVISESTASSNIATSPVFVVGNGTITDADPDYGVATRSDALIVRKNGIIEAPSQTIAEIEAGTDKTLVTKEYVKKITVRKINSATTLSNSDNGTVILLTASCTVTLPNGLVDGFNCSFATQSGATMTYSLGGSVVLINNSSSSMVPLSSHTLVNTGVANEYLTVGL